MSYETPEPLIVKGKEVHSFEVNLCERCGGVMPPYRRLIHCSRCVGRDPIDGSEIDSVRHWTLFILDAPNGDEAMCNAEVRKVAEADVEMVNEYADHLHWIVKGEQLPIKDTVVIPIPPQESGFTLSGIERLANTMASSLSLPYVEGLEFVRAVPDYRNLSAEDRKRTIAGALKARQRFDGQNVFLVDDVMISGYTMKEAARALRCVGANRVYGFVCGRGVTFSELAEHLTRID